MGNIAIHRANELPSDARLAVERVLGRALEPDEEVSIMALSPHSAPIGEARQQIARELDERIDKTSEAVRDAPDEVQETAIDEALRNVRAKTR
jgi:hypothetical protein